MIAEFDKGTILLDEWPRDVPLPAEVKWDGRVGKYRCLGYFYSELKRILPNIIDKAMTESPALNVNTSFKLRKYQEAAISEWEKNGRRGIVVLPTAAGKTHIGLEAILRNRKSAIIVAPTIELVQQWRENIEKAFNIHIGQLGGDEKDLQPITVSTYDSAYLFAEKIGNRFDLLIADEVHHMASEKFSEIAKMYTAPERLGLTATYERADGLHELLVPYMGGKMFEMGYEELTDFLSGFEIIRIPVELTDEEEAEYNRNREIFLSYLRRYHVNLKGTFDFQRFIMQSWNREGREALLAWRRSREIAFSARAKIDFVRYVMSKHREDKMFIFTEDTETAYMVSKEFLIPAMTYLTPGPERKKYLDLFREGKITKIATSRILDEGVDVPDASVAVVISGSGSTRQFRQRLGRIIRPAAGKNAIMYELITSGTGEKSTSRRRRRGVPNRMSDGEA